MAKNSAEHCVVNAAGLFDSLQFRVFHCLWPALQICKLKKTHSNITSFCGLRNVSICPIQEACFASLVGFTITGQWLNVSEVPKTTLEDSLEKAQDSEKPVSSWLRFCSEWPQVRISQGKRRVAQSPGETGHRFLEGLSQCCCTDGT